MDKQFKHLTDRVLVYAVIWAISYIATLVVLKYQNIPLAAGLVLSLITVMAFAVFMYKYYRSIYFMDEVQIKMQMEAVVIAFSLGLVLLITLGLLDLVVTLNKANWSYTHLVPMFVLFYFIGLFISKRKYNFENEKHD